MSYNNVSISYANNISEAEKMIEYYRNQGYIFINYSKSNHRFSPYSRYEEDFDTHHVIGQEFDNVLMLMDFYILIIDYSNASGTLFLIKITYFNAVLQIIHILSRYYKSSREDSAYHSKCAKAF